MTLTTRLSVFFLAALAAVLVGFSTALFLIARAAAYRELDRRVDGALDAMTSAVEVKPNGLEWEPDERGLTLSARPTDPPVTWGVFDEGAALRAHSGAGHTAAFLAAFTGREASSELFDHADGAGREYRVRVRRVDAPGSFTAARPVPATPRRKQGTVLLVAGVSYAATHAHLTAVASTLAATSGGVWLAALLLARRLCRRALAPVRGMAEAARAVRAADLS
ncbi:MAG TPA: hypothetical protein VH092_09220, partial [Urbifossiella sp.]|nr:hypothetical protein [Urbifossiella sp.]